MNATLKHVPFESAVAAVVRSAGGAYVHRGHVYLIRPAAPRVSKAPVAAAPAAVPVPAAAPDKSVTLDLRDVPLRDALETLFRSRPDASFALDPSVETRTVTAKIREVPFDQALQIILRSSGTRALHQGGVYDIRAARTP